MDLSGQTVHIFQIMPAFSVLVSWLADFQENYKPQTRKPYASNQCSSKPTVHLSIHLTPSFPRLIRPDADLMLLHPCLRFQPQTRRGANGNDFALASSEKALLETKRPAKFAWLHSRILSSKYVNWILAHSLLAYECFKELPVVARIVSFSCVISLEQKYT